jgi:toxin ParE1/3/4
VKKNRVTFSDAAIADILEQADWYEAQADRNLAQRWQEAVTATLLRVARRPGTGARCTFTVDELRGTCRIPVAGFAKHLIFYQSRAAEILVLRVLHGARDLEGLFSE